MTEEAKHVKRLSGRLPPSKEIVWTMRFAIKIAHERTVTNPEIRDLLAGIYLSALERLARYWDEWERLEDFLATHCDVYQPRLVYWLDIWNSMQSEDVPDQLTTFDAKAGKIILHAQELASKSGSAEIKLEHLLIAIAESQDGLCERFVATGMKIDLVHSRMRN